MTGKSAATIAAVASAALALPAAASAEGIATGVKNVKSRTASADKALDRASALFAKGRDGKAVKRVVKSRKEMAKAEKVAAGLARRADDERERAAAARAHVLVADQRDENIEQLVGLLDEAEGRVENAIAKAALADTVGRDKALSVLHALVGRGVSGQAQAGIVQAIAGLSTGRDEEVRVEAEALASAEVSEDNKDELAATVEANLEGQQVAASRLGDLIADPSTPPESKVGLQTAYDAVTGEHQAAADTLAAFSDRIPAGVRTFVEQVVSQARQDAQSMRANRPAPPSGGSLPPGTPGR
ncbi:MAG: hypothetical protein M3N16_08605 [Actinomycetota bacterium]|nr:hypothetical protein [Actinomycetota bacterium]